MTRTPEEVAASPGTGASRAPGPARPFARLRTPLIALAVSFLALNIYAQAEPTLLQRGLGMLLILLCALPTLAWFGGWASGRPWLPFYGGLYAAYFAFPVFLRDGFYGRGIGFPECSEAQITVALGWATLGWVFFLLGFGLLRHTKLSRTIPQVQLAWARDPEVIKKLVVVLGVVSLPAFLLDTMVLTYGFYADGIVYSPWIVFVVRFVGRLIYLAIALLFLLQLRGELGRKGKIFLWVGLFLPAVWFALSTGLITRLVEPFLIVILAYSALRAARPWRAMAMCAVTLVIVSVLLSTRLDFRDKVWTASDTADPVLTLERKNLRDTLTALQDGATIAERITYGWLYLKTIVDNFRQVGGGRYERRLDAAAYSFDALTTFAQVRERTPEPIPYRYGTTYTRISVLELPLTLLGYESRDTQRGLARQYQLIAPRAATVGFNFHPMIEMYMNFGTLAIPVGMFLLGLFSCAMQRLFIYPNAAVAPIAAALPFLVLVLVTSRSELAASWGATWLFAYLVFWALLHLVMSRVLRGRQSGGAPVTA